MLWNVCIDVLQHRKRWIRTEDKAQEPHVMLAHHPTTASFEAAALEFCEICYPFWNLLDKESLSSMRAVDEKWVAKHGSLHEPVSPYHGLQDLNGFITLLSAFNLGKDLDVEATGLDLLISMSFDSDYEDEVPSIKGKNNMYVVCRVDGAFRSNPI